MEKTITSINLMETLSYRININLFTHSLRVHVMMRQCLGACNETTIKDNRMEFCYTIGSDSLSFTIINANGSISGLMIALMIVNLLKSST